jgi:hypothetical protein
VEAHRASSDRDAVPQKSKKQSKRRLHRPEPEAGLTALAITEQRIDEQASRIDRLHSRRLALLGVLALSLVTYTLVAALALTQAHQPTAVVGLGAGIAILGLAMVAATAAWPWRDPDWIGPAIDQVIAHTPAEVPDTKRRRRERPSKPRPTLAEADLRVSVARWNAIRIEATEAQIDRLAEDTRRAARWTLVTTLAVAGALIALALVRIGRLILEDEPTRAFFVG